MAKRKYSLLADEDEKYEQEYLRELAEENKLKENEIKTQLTNKGKQGVSMVSGNISPIVGEKMIYQIADWYPDTPLKDRNPAKVTWELFKKRKNGKFTTTSIKKVGVSSFTFGEVACQNTYRLEAYLHKPEGGGLIVNPKPSKIPKIGKVELHYVDDEKGDTFSFHDKLRAKAHTTNLIGKELIFTLWEDDAKGKGHNANNKAIDSKPAKVSDNGLAIAEFILTKALMEKAMQGEADAKQLEFYVTVEYYIGKKHDSENVNINNPLYKAPEKKNVQTKAKDSPAEQKPISKKEEKGIIGISMESLWDWAESKGKALKNLEIRLPKIEGKSMVEVASPKKESQNGTCICKQYDLIWGNKVSCEFRKKVVEICKELWGEENKIKMANGLMAVINVETGGSFKSHQIMGKTLKDVNSITKEDFWLIKKDKRGREISRSSRAVGLIQFTQTALQSVNEFTQGSGFDKLHEVKLRFAKMGEINQLDYVKKYFEDSKTKIKTPEDIYLHVFAPKGVGKNDDYILYARGTEEYLQNKSIDEENNRDGNIQRNEILGRYKTSFNDGNKNKSQIFTCTNIIIPKEETNDKCPEDCSQCFEYSDVVDTPKINNQSNNVNKNRFHRTPRYNSRHPNGYLHTGIDILTTLNTELKSLLCGEVVEASDTGGDLGKVVTIKSKDKNGQYIWIKYCHLNSFSVTRGQKIKHGQILGKSGNTGNAHGIQSQYYHVHIEASTNGVFYGGNTRVDPEKFMKTKFDETTIGNPIK